MITVAGRGELIELPYYDDTASFVDEIRDSLEKELKFLSDEQDIVHFEERKIYRGCSLLLGFS